MKARSRTRRLGSSIGFSLVLLAAQLSLRSAAEGAQSEDLSAVDDQTYLAAFALDRPLPTNTLCCSPEGCVPDLSSIACAELLTDQTRYEPDSGLADDPLEVAQLQSGEGIVRSPRASGAASTIKVHSCEIIILSPSLDSELEGPWHYCEVSTLHVGLWGLTADYLLLQFVFIDPDSIVPPSAGDNLLALPSFITVSGVPVVFEAHLD